jgi:hypothetical protein
MELLILSKLKWDLTAITPYDYLDYMINSLSTTTSSLDSLESSVRRNTEKLVTLCATDETFLSMSPSLVASASLVAAIEQDSNYLTNTLSYAINLNQIVACILTATKIDLVSC